MLDRYTIEIAIPEALKKYAATKGSITVDGISLTTNLVKDNIACLNIIPHYVAEVTNIGRHWKVGGPSKYRSRFNCSLS